MNGTEVNCAGEKLMLYPNRVAFWPKTGDLFLADVHLGKRAGRAFRGMYTPDGSDRDDKDLIKAISKDLNAKHLYVLGDLFHDNFALDAESITASNAWVDGLGIPVSLILGNHDAKAAKGLSSLRIGILPSGVERGPFWLSHEPDPKKGFFNLCGHLHPGVRMKDAAGCAHKAKAFWWREDQLVLPAFGTTTSMTHAEAQRRDVLYICAEDKVFELKR